MYNKYFNSLSIKIIKTLCILLCAGLLCGFCEFISGKYLRYSIEAGQIFGLITEDLKSTALYSWELDYFRICTISTVAIVIVILGIYLGRCHKFKRFDSLKLIIVLLSIIFGLNSILAFYYFLFLVVSPYLISCLVWFSATLVSACSLYLIITFKKHYKNFRNYDFGTKTYFVNIPKQNILGFFEYNEFQGIIKCGESNEYFTKEDDNFIIYLNTDNVFLHEEEFIMKFGYWVYYIDKVASRLSAKETNYHEGAIAHGEQLLAQFKENTNKSKKIKR